jgi:hypothetical protein
MFSPDVSSYPQSTSQGKLYKGGIPIVGTPFMATLRGEIYTWQDLRVVVGQGESLIFMSSANDWSFHVHGYQLSL